MTQQHSLQALNTFGVAAQAERCHRLNDAQQVAALWQREGAPELILGGGSNILLVQQQLSSVWLNCIAQRQVLHRDADTVRVRFGAGESWDQAVAWSLEQSAYGLENLSLIPGRCGAAPIQNIGAYGVQVESFIHRIEALDLRTGQHTYFNRDDCQFAYRHSIFRSAAGRHWLILAIELNLPATPQVQLDYPGIREQLAHNGQLPPGNRDPAPQHVRQAICQIRQRKLPDPAVLGNAGSFFKNPIVPQSQAQRLKERHPQLPCWPHGAGQHKLSAAWLIDDCGFKGYRTGDAGVHQHHALVLVNYGQASGAQILALAEQVQQRVLERYDVQLEPEPLIIR